MKKTSCAALIGLMSAALITGCDWEGSGEDTGWNSSSIDVDFSGVYRAPGTAGGYVVTKSSGSSVVSESKTIGTGNGSNKGFGGTLHAPVRAGSVVVQAGGIVLSDSAANGALTGTGGSGSIAYESGQIAVTFNTAPSAGTPIVARYGYGSVHASGASAGIVSLTVQQAGNTMTIIDNNGDRYTGKLGGKTIASQRQVTETQQQISEVYQFSASGTSRGVAVKMQGTFQAQVTVYFSENYNSQGQSFAYSLTELYRTANLAMDGTWIEPNTSATINGIGPQDQRIEVVAVQ
jgi:hypothetical protein